MKSYKQKSDDDSLSEEGLVSTEEQEKALQEEQPEVVQEDVAEKTPEDALEEEPIETSEAATEEPVAEAITIVEDPVGNTNTLLVLSQDDEPEPTSRSWPPTREQIWTACAFWGVILLGAILRFWGLGDKPLHHDESLHAYYSLQLMHNLETWANCFNPGIACYRYDPLLHGPFQFHAIAFVYKVSQLLGLPDHGVNTYTVRIVAATLGTVIVGLPYFLRDRLGTVGAWLACLLLAVSPSMVYFSRFAREDIYMACFTLLLVVAVARYLRDKKMRWIVIAALAYALSYATKEATFLTVAIFGSFFGALIVWELGQRWSLPRSKSESSRIGRYIPQKTSPVLLIAYFIVLGILGKVFFGWLKSLSIYITDPKNTNAANAYVQNLKDQTVALIPWLGILLGVLVLIILIREMGGKTALPNGWSPARFFDRRTQPLLHRLFSISWMHWFFALLSGWAVFVILFSVLFTNLRSGMGDGIWQGLYYWLQQQQVARGGQPWYYYLLLLPLYEQIGLVFGLAGMVRAVLQPTRFRLFLLYWFVGNLFIYSWAAEKMPWLLIHLTMPLLLLAAVGLEPAVSRVLALLPARFFAEKPMPKEAEMEQVGEEKEERTEEPVAEPVLPERKRRVGLSAGWAIAIVAFAGLLLLPTLQNMRELTYIHQADAPYEMLIYVQTTTDINIVMSKVDALDQAFYGGKHQMPIGVTADATWPYAWYLRDYTGVCFNFPTPCQEMAKTVPVVITGGDNLPGAQAQYSNDFNFHQYHLRTQWDQGYMPPPCVRTASNPCTDPQPYTGVGPWLWLSYGDNPPPNAQFDPLRAASNIWKWWWERKPFGSVDGSYDMGLFIRKNLNVQP